MMKNVKSVAIMVAICSVMALLLATTNSFTAPIIEKNAGAAANAALLEVMPEGKSFEAVDLANYKLPETVAEVQKEASGGYVITLITTGYGTDMVIMCGVSADGKITGAKCLSSNETLGKEKEYGATFTGVDAAALEGVDTIAGATLTTAAYKNAIKDALNAAIILGGGSVDIRDEAQILADNLTAALPAGEGKFQKMFIVEDITGVDAIYSADNGQGYVCVVGETFIGVDNAGIVATEGVTDTDAAIKAVKLIKDSKLTDLNTSGLGELADYVLSAKKTATGNYVLETKGAGYGIKGGSEYHPASNEYIVVRVAISKSGKILDCVTVSQAETDGLGSACADETFYGQFDGKTEGNYTEIDAIGGATLTTDGYKQAIQKAFDAYKALKGGAK